MRCISAMCGVSSVRLLRLCAWLVGQYHVGAVGRNFRRCQTPPPDASVIEWQNHGRLERTTGRLVQCGPVPKGDALGTRLSRGYGIPRHQTGWRGLRVALVHEVHATIRITQAQACQGINDHACSVKALPVARLVLRA